MYNANMQDIYLVDHRTGLFASVAEAVGKRDETVALVARFAGSGVLRLSVDDKGEPQADYVVTGSDPTDPKTVLFRPRTVMIAETEGDDPQAVDNTPNIVQRARGKVRVDGATYEATLLIPTQVDVPAELIVDHDEAQVA